jgi:6-phosphogluconolactonase/glucosamine-6-phosphate isomerase/deaminase
MEMKYLESLDDLSLLVQEDVVKAALSHGGLVRIALPGGRSVVPLVQGILSCPKEILSRLKLYLVDERIKGETNLETLLSAGLEEAFSKGILDIGQLVIPQLNKAFVEADAILDLVYLGVGEDGHVASLFVGSYPELNGESQSEIAKIENSPKPPSERLTATYRGFYDRARLADIRLLFLGEGKHRALDRLLADNETAATLPCSFFCKGDFKVAVITDLKGINL